MDSVGVWVTPFPVEVVLFDIATERVVFGGRRFICRIVSVGATGSIMCEVNTTLIAKLVPLSPCCKSPLTTYYNMMHVFS